MRRLLQQFYELFAAMRKSTVVAVKTPKADFAMYVDGVESVVEISDTAFEPLPEILRHDVSKVVTHVAHAVKPS
ncbi:MAG: hypothetical protein KIT11_01625 [Fimbriimonadaceae bacterium]|nr:hypothetical protein [Fimbriimonadaceae bacterium]QYK54930.1 MAG: hypothetical protein KF733_07910 [Fimbriimonadaceae bacterium]